jgi:hypothetical protein
MAYVRVLSPSQATGELADVYRYMREVGGVGMIANIVRLFSLRPGSMRRMIRTWELSNWVGTEPRTTREMVGAAVSRLNDCHY